MKNDKLVAMQMYFDKEITTCCSAIEQLNTDERNDDATFIKVKKNVLDIFRVIMSVGIKKFDSDEEKVSEFLKERLTQIPNNWRSSFYKASINGKVQTAHLEKIKLETVAEIELVFKQIWGCSDD